MQLSNLFICGFRDAFLGKETADKLLELNPAGIILFDNNIENPAQLKKLINDLKDLLGENLLISVDQEGGKVERLRKVASSLPSLKALGIAARENINYIDEHTELFSEDLLELGFNLVFAPCLDLNTEAENPIIGTRSLGSDSKIVSEQTDRLLKALSKYPILNCAKHFPGHGASSLDSHYELPFIDLSDENFFEAHLSPFRIAIENNSDMLMTAHALYKLSPAMKTKLLEIFKNDKYIKDDLLETLAASINPYFVEGLLKNLLGFKGLCVTDEITMKALSRFGDYKRICELMIKAGNDLIIWNTNLDEALEVERSSPFCHFSKTLRNKIENSLEKKQRVINERLKTTTHKERAWGLNVQRREYLEKSMLDIAKKAVALKSQQRLNPKYILLFKHPKLEAAPLQKAFPEARFIFFSEKNESSRGLEASVGLDKISLTKEAHSLIFTFQINKYPELINSIRSFKSTHPLSLHVECDSDFIDADLLLRGANLVHYIAAQQLISANP